MPRATSPNCLACSCRHLARTLRSIGGCCSASQTLIALEAASLRALAVGRVHSVSLVLQKKATHKTLRPLRSTISWTERPVGRRAFQCHVRQPCGILCTSACPGRPLCCNLSAGIALGMPASPVSWHTSGIGSSLHSLRAVPSVPPAEIIACENPASQCRYLAKNKTMFQGLARSGSSGSLKLGPPSCKVEYYVPWQSATRNCIRLGPFTWYNGGRLLQDGAGACKLPSSVRPAQFLLYSSKFSISRHTTYHDSTTRASTQLYCRADFLERGCSLWQRRVH